MSKSQISEEARDEVRAWFKANRIDRGKWAKAHGTTREIVNRLLTRGMSASKGEAFRIAVAMGLRALMEPKVASSLMPVFAPDMSTQHRLELLNDHFERNGLSKKSWAEDRGFDPQRVYAVLHGFIPRKPGPSKQIAIALGLLPPKNNLCSTLSQTKIERARAYLESNGITITRWAKENGFQYCNVISVLSGVSKHRRGESFVVAVALGIVEPPLGYTGPPPLRFPLPALPPNAFAHKSFGAKVLLNQVQMPTRIRYKLPGA